MIIGVVGKANVGKSTFFKAATLMEVEIANYPFATIKPNHGVGFVSLKCVDTEFNVQCNPRVGFCREHIRFVPVDMIDVAGLVPGAHEGKGMGLEFLNDLNQADALIHVIDVSGGTNEKGEPLIPGEYDPSQDILFLEEELDHWYIKIFQKVWDKFSRQAVMDKEDSVKAITKQFSGVGATEEIVEGIIKGKGLEEKRLNEWSREDVNKVASELRRITKPMIIAANKIDVKGAYETYLRLKEQFRDRVIVACSAESELALREADKTGLIDYIPGESDFKVKGQLSGVQSKALEFIRENVLKKYGGTGVQQVINSTIFDVLKYIAVFPGGVNKLADKDGNILPDCFLLPEGSTALDFAYKIHSDLGDRFIRAIDVRKKLTVGKEHILHHRDVIEIISDK